MDSSGETQEERQGKMLLHTEYSLLSLLHNQDGVVHHHGLFQVWPLSMKKGWDEQSVLLSLRRFAFH